MMFLHLQALRAELQNEKNESEKQIQVILSVLFLSEEYWQSMNTYTSCISCLQIVFFQGEL